MKVTCKYNTLAAIEDDSLRRHVERYIHQPEIDLVPGQQYEVFGVVFWDGVPWFYICEGPQSEYPVPSCAAFFQLDEMRVPDGWVLHWDGHSSSLVPRWWAEMPNFLERLVDGETRAQQVFLNARREREVPGSASRSRR
jgi:hypothetical protein